MLIPIEILKKYVDINVDLDEFVKNFSLKSAEVDSFDDFVSVKGLKVGKIIDVKNHPNSDHLHITTVDLKDEILEIVCGAPNVLVNKKVIVAKVGVNLPDRENPGKTITMKKALIRGVESNGMNCALEELGIDHKFQGYDGIYYLNDDVEIGIDPLEYLHLNDKVLEIELTPNRNDLLSIIGVAYDTKAMLDSKIHLEFEKANEIKEEADIKVSTTTINCMRYYSKVIKDVKISESPAWLKGALMKMNIRPINNVVDITNYCLMVTGQPLHAFDYDEIKTKNIVVKMAEDGYKFTTLDHQERILTKDDIVITDGEKPLCLGGVMGGLNSEVEPTTKNIFLEAALFNPKNIKNTSKRLNLSSESSMRFEKGINPEMTKYALDLASKMLQDIAGGKVLSKGYYFDNLDTKDNVVKVKMSSINSVLGRIYDPKQIEKIFDSLSFKSTFKDGEFTVYVPKRRGDIETYQDLIEEIVRIDGYDKLDAVLPKSENVGKLSPYQKFVRNIRHLLSYNMNEVITYSLTSFEKATYFDNEEHSLVKIMNPLVDDRVYMRHSSLPSLLETIRYNLNRKTNNVFLYEIGRRYEMEKEDKILSGALTGIISSTLWKGEKEEVDFFYLKGLIENLFDKLYIKNYKIIKPSTPLKGLHPHVSASIALGKDEVVGFIGKLHPEAMKYFDVPETYVFELNLDKLFNYAHPIKTVKGISKYPSIVRDLALVVSEDLSSQELIDEIKKVGKRMLTDVKVFDLYKGQNLGEGKKQLALSLTFQDMTKTLETTEIDALIDAILKHLDNLGIKIRM